MANQVRITKDDQEGFCLEESVKAYERHGWTRADDGSSEQASTGTEPASENQATTKEEG